MTNKNLEGMIRKDTAYHLPIRDWTFKGLFSFGEESRTIAEHSQAQTLFLYPGAYFYDDDRSHIMCEYIVSLPLSTAFY